MSWTVYRESADNKGQRTLAKVGEFASRREANSVRPPRNAGQHDYPRMILYRGDQFVNSTGW